MKRVDRRGYDPALRIKEETLKKRGALSAFDFKKGGGAAGKGE